MMGYFIIWNIYMWNVIHMILPTKLQIHSPRKHGLQWELGGTPSSHT